MPVSQQFQRAYDRHMAGDLSEAEARYRQIIQRSPRDANVLHMLGVLCGQTKRLDQAINHLQRSIVIEPEVAPVHFNLANVLRDAGKAELAIQAYMRTVELDPTHASAFLNLGLTLLDEKQLKDAVTAIEAAVNADPQHHAARHQLALLYFAADFHEAAREQLDKAIEIAPGVVDYWHNLGSVHRKMGDPDRAIECFEHALTLGQHSIPTMVSLAELLIEADRESDALNWCKQALSVNPDHPKATDLLGRLAPVGAVAN